MTRGQLRSLVLQLSLHKRYGLLPRSLYIETESPGSQEILATWDYVWQLALFQW
jgi:hypothetical protein